MNDKINELKEEISTVELEIKGIEHAEEVLKDVKVEINYITVHPGRYSHNNFLMSLLSSRYGSKDLAKYYTDFKDTELKL